MPRGGDRNGRRPTLPPEQRRVKVAYMVSPETKDRIKAESERVGMSQGKVLDFASIDQMAKNELALKYPVLNEYIKKGLTGWEVVRILVEGK